MPPRSFLLAFAFVAAIACGSDEPPLTEEQALAAWARVTCNNIKRCRPDQLALYGLTAATCEERLMADLTAAGDPRCHGDIFDGAAARDCIAQMEVQGCSTEIPEVCRQVCRDREP